MEDGEELRKTYLEQTGQPAGGKNYLLEGAPEEVLAYMESIRNE